ncbi:MAG: ISL3 family transposase [Selenomonas sp.]|nr:ISL3 family transposase [Selenomonas sp.]
MATANTIFKDILCVKGIVVEKYETYTDSNQVVHLRIRARVAANERNRCPVCGRKCKGYDAPHNRKVWRALDCGGLVTEIASENHRIECPEHGVLTAAVPWAYHGSSFTKTFEQTVAWLSKEISRSAIAELMRIDWATVGRCISRVRNDLEPNPAGRLDGLVNIGIDETSYKKGHKYITVVVNHDTNTVVWVHEGHGKAVLEKLFRSMSGEQRASVQVVTGDGARWITDCTEAYLPNAERCVDAFHVVEWIHGALDKVRLAAWREAQATAKERERLRKKSPGRPRRDDSEAAILKGARQKASAIKGSMYALGKNPENLTDNQKEQLELVTAIDSKLCRGYARKEQLRLILHMKNEQEAQCALRKWLWWASHSRIPAFVELGKKIRRHFQHILNTIRLGMSNARIESTNNKIKLIIRRAYGFRNLQNMMDMVMLICSDLHIPLPNRSAKQLEAV